LIHPKSIDLVDAFSFEIKRTLKRENYNRYDSEVWCSNSHGLLYLQCNGINLWSWKLFSEDHKVFPQPEKSMKVQNFWISSFAFSPSERWLVVGTQNSKIVIFDLSFENLHQEINLFPSQNDIWITAVSFLPGIEDESKILFARTNDEQNDKIFQWDLSFPAASPDADRISGNITTILDLKVQSVTMWIRKLDVYQNPRTKKFIIFVQTDSAIYSFFRILLKDNLQVLKIIRYGIQSFFWNAKRNFAILKNEEYKYFICKS
jgi:WD40 repeat protein